MHNAVPVTLERRPQPARFLLASASACLVGAHRERRQPPLLVVANARLEGVGNNPSGELRHEGKASSCPGAREALGGTLTTPTLPGVGKGLSLDGPGALSATDPCRTGTTRPQLR